MKKYLSIAALALVGAVMTSCSSDDNIIEEPQQPAATNYSMTKTITVSLDGNEAGARAITRALTSGGVKTFAAGDKLAVIYMNDGGDMTKVETEELKAGNISGDGKTATFTVTLTEAPKTSGHGGPLTYIYPASIASSDGYVDYTQLSTQNGTLTTLASNLDACRKYQAEWDGGDLPALTLTNELTIGKFILKNPSSTAFNNTLTSVTISDGTNTYTITPSASAADDPIWVAMRPISAGSAVTVTATDGTNDYSKTITIASGKDLIAGNIYPINVTMIKTQLVDLASLGTDYVAQNGDILINTLGSAHQISIANGATVTLRGATIDCLTWGNDYAGITCSGNATIVLEGTNTVKSGASNSDGCNYYPGIYVSSGNTLTIQGSGTLNASCFSTDGAVNYYGAGIGGGENLACGNIIINGGTITATGGTDGAAGIGGGDGSACGNITINGGTITATGGNGAAGIGAARNSTCGSISITNGTVEAHAGNFAAGIGAALASGNHSTCSGVSISGGSVTAYGGLGAAGIGSGLSYTGGNSDPDKYCQCGNISITGGTVVATGGNGLDINDPFAGQVHAYGGAGIGTGATAGTRGYQSNCGSITIGAGVYSVTVTKGDDAQNSIGKNHSSTSGTCGIVTIEDGAYVTQN